MNRLRQTCENPKFDSFRPVSVVRRLAGPFFVFAGIMHFVIPRTYRRIMPPYVPAHRAMVYASGVAEIAGGAGLMLPRRRRAAGWWLIATLLAVFPANVHMALHPDEFPQGPGRHAQRCGRACRSRECSSPGCWRRCAGRTDAARARWRSWSGDPDTPSLARHPDVRAFSQSRRPGFARLRAVGPGPP